MDSVIFRYLNEDRQEGVAITSYQFFKNNMKTAKQLICLLGWKHTEEQRAQIQEMDEEELYEFLDGVMKTYITKCEYPC